jgi:aminopeptidase N
MAMGLQTDIAAAIYQERNGVNLWDFILVHESGHEWFGNSLTGESWIHEGFTKYLETIYTSHLYGVEAGNDYAIGINKRIKNNKPVIGGNTSDYYNKASAMLHMIRQITGDTVFKKMLQALNNTFYHSIVNTGQILQVMNKIADRDFTKIFDQYLTTIDIPVLEYTIKNKTLRYRWTGCVGGFNMPVKISVGNLKDYFIYPETKWKMLELKSGEWRSDCRQEFLYVNSRQGQSIFVHFKNDRFRRNS